MTILQPQHIAPAQRGYTLMEMLVASTILLIVCGMAVPAFSGAVRRTQSESTIYSLANASQRARNMAISQRQPAVFCAMANAQTCGDDWTRGAMVFVDANDNRIVDSDEHIDTQLPATPTGSKLVMRAALGKQYLRFMPNGMLENTAGSIIYCPPGGTARDARNIIFSRNGRLRFGGDKNHDGILENAEGQPLSCPP